MKNTESEIAEQGSSEALYQAVVDDYCEIRRVTTAWKSTIGVMVSFARQHGRERVREWMSIADSRLGHGVSEKRFARFVSGCRRRWLTEQGNALLGSA